MNRPFRNRSTTPRLSPDEAARQGRASSLALTTLREPAAVIAFLNTHHEAIGGRPIDVAIATPEGLARVEEAIGLLKQA